MKKMSARWNLILIFWLLVFSANLQSQDVQTPEEYIYGQDLSIRKTEIILLPVPETRIEFPPVTLPEWPQPPLSEKTAPETPLEKPGEIVPETKAATGRQLEVTAGKFSTFGLSFLHQERNLDFNQEFSADIENSSGWRQHQRKRGIIFSWYRNPQAWQKPSLAADIFLSEQQLPGPVGSVLSEERENFALHFSCQQQLERWPVTLKMSESYYQIDSMRDNYFKISLEEKYGVWDYLQELEWQQTKENSLQMAGGCSLRYERQFFQLGLTAKEIQEGGFRILPQGNLNLSENWKFFLKSQYGMVDFWNQVQNSDYLEIKLARYKPEESYSLGMEYLTAGKRWSFSFQTRQTWWKSFYTWADEDGNFLYEPVRLTNLSATEMEWETTFLLTPGTRFFLQGKQIFFGKKVQYLPERELISGISWGKGHFTGNLNFVYTGPREFSGRSLPGYTRGKLHLSWNWKPDFTFLVTVDNLSGTRYQYVPGYPAPGRYFSAGFRIRF